MRTSVHVIDVLPQKSQQKRPSSKLGTRPKYVCRSKKLEDTNNSQKKSAGPNAGPPSCWSVNPFDDKGGIRPVKSKF